MKVIIELVETDIPMYCERVNHALRELLQDDDFLCGRIHKTYESTVKEVTTQVRIEVEKD